MQTSVRKITLNLNKLNYEISDPTIETEGMQVPRAKDCYTLIKLPGTYTKKHDSLLTIKKLQHQTKLKNEDNIIWNDLKSWCWNRSSERRQSREIFGTPEVDWKT